MFSESSLSQQGEVRESTVWIWAVAVGILWGVVLVGYPLTAAIAAVADLPNRFTSIGVRGFTIVLALATFAYLGLMQGRLYRGWLLAPLLLFWVLYLARLAYDSAFLPEVLRLTPVEYVMWAVGGSLIPMLAFLVRFTDRELSFALRTVGLMGGLAAVMIYFLVLLQPSKVYPTGRLGFTTLDPISLGNFGLTIALAGAAALLAIRRPGLLWGALYAFLMIAGIPLTLMSATRGTMIGLIILWPLLCIVARSRRALLLAVITIPAIVAGSLAVELKTPYEPLRRFISEERVEVVLAWFSPEYADTATVSFGDTDEDETEPEAAVGPPPLPVFVDDERMDLLSRGWGAFKDNIWLGAGIEPLGYYPHNTLLESFMATGIVGGALYAIALLAAGWSSLVLFVRDRRHFWMPILFGQMFVLAMLSGSLYSAGAVWCLMVAVIVRASDVAPGRDREVAAPTSGT